MKTQKIVSTLLVIGLLLTVDVINVSADGPTPKATPIIGNVVGSLSSGFSLLSAYTTDNNGAGKTSFNFGNSIEWRGDITNNTGNMQTAYFAWLLKTPCSSSILTLWSGNLDTQPGSWVWQLPGTVNNSTCAGEYTYTLKVTYNGLTTSKDAKYWAYNACNSSCQTLLNQSLKLTNGKTVQALKLDGTAPVVGLDNGYGKPGQWPFGFKQMARTPLTSNSGNRYPGLYENLIDQFGVNTNPRYKAYSTYSFCNTFAGDVARAMGNPFPQKSSTDPATIGFPYPYGKGTSSNSLWLWFIQKSAGSGWREVPNNSSGLQQLISHVNNGKMAIAINDRHVAVVRPWQLNVTKAGNLRIAQAGATNNTYIFLSTGFGSSPAPRFFIHD